RWQKRNNLEFISISARQAGSAAESKSAMTLRNAVKIVFLAACSLPLVAGAQQVVPLDREPSHHFALQNEYVRVFKVEVAPHASTLLHQHDRDYIFVTLGASSVESDV